MVKKLPACFLVLVSLSAWAADAIAEVPVFPVHRFVFEGEVTEVGPEFVEKFMPGDVLSGTVGWSTEAPNRDPHPGFALYHDNLSDFEFIIDRNFIEITSGTANRYYNALVVNDAQQSEGDEDWYTICLPFDTADVINNQYTSAWLEIVLSDSTGEMIDDLKPPAKPPKFESGKFELSYSVAGQAEHVIAAQGTITLFGRLDGTSDPEPTREELIDIVYALDDAVTERDAYIQDILAELAAAKERIQSLESKVAQLEKALSEAEGTQLAADLELQNARLREQLRAATEQQAATADIIAALKASEASLARKVAAQTEALSAPQEEPATESVTAAPPPMLARPDFEKTATPQFVQLPQPESAQVETVSVSPTAAPPEVADDFSDEVAPSTPVTAPPEEEEEPEFGSPAINRRGPRR